MPLISLEAMLNIIDEQQTEIKELKEHIAQLESMLENQNTEMLTQELEHMVSEYPEKLKNSVIASIDIH